MKKRMWMLILGAVALIGIVVAIVCFVFLTPKDKTPDFECDEAYQPMLKEFYEVLAAPDKAENIYDGLHSVREAALELGAQALTTFGYTLQDVNKDGIEEIFIGHFDNTDGVKNEIYAAFTYDGQSLIPLFEKQKRNTFALTDAGTFYFYGSDGAKYHILAEYELTADRELVCKDYYFTYPKGGNDEAFGYYHNITGEWDVKSSEALDMTPVAFEELRKSLADRTVSLDDVKFSETGNGKSAK